MTMPVTPLLGAHVSIAGGLALAPERARSIGGNVFQIFSGSPRNWEKPSVSAEAADSFRRAMRSCGISLGYFHASYLLNLADDGFIGRKSVETLSAELEAAALLGLRGSIVHLGSFKAAREQQKEKVENQELFEANEQKKTAPAYERHPKYDCLIHNVKAALKGASSGALFIVENAGTRKIGRTIQEIARIISDVSDQRVRVCLDVCHLHAAGYDLSTEKKLDDFLKQFDTVIGLKRLEVLHVNDSRDGFGSLRDRHENIGEGKVGREVFRLLLNHPKTRKLPFLLEVPGFDGRGPDKKNLDVLKSLLFSQTAVALPAVG